MADDDINSRVSTNETYIQILLEERKSQSEKIENIRQDIGEIKEGIAYIKGEKMELDSLEDRINQKTSRRIAIIGTIFTIAMGIVGYFGVFH